MNENTSLSAWEPVGAAPRGRNVPPHSILLVEDDDSLRSLNCQALLLFGYEVDAVADGAAAWEALNTDGYDLMITDNSMPKVTGVELLKKMRANRMALPVIMATRTLPKDEFRRYPWLQPDATLVKPYTVTELLKMVKNVLRAADDADELSARRTAPSPRN